MSVITYALVCYGLTAVISLLVIAVVLAVNSIVAKTEPKPESK